MALDLTLLPDQPKAVGTRLDVSSLPDQPTTSGIDLSKLPDQPEPNIFQRGASAVIDPLKQAFAPPRAPIEDPSPHADIQQGGNLRERFGALADPNVLFPHTTQGQLGKDPIGNLLAPVTSLLAESAGRDFFGGGRGGKTKGITKAFGLPTAALIDTAGTGLKIFGDVIEGVFKVGRAGIRALKPGKREKESFLPFAEDVKQSFLGKDRGHGKIIQQDLVPQLNERFERVVAEGMPPEKAAGQMQRELSIRGALPDMAEEIVLAAVFFRKFLNKKLFGKEERLAAIQKTRSELRAFAAQENLEAQAGKVPLLEGPGARVPGAAAPSVAAREPIVGERFIGGEGGFKRQIPGQQVENIIEKAARQAPQAARQVGQPGRVARQVGDIEVVGGVSQAAPLSREARLAQAAQGARAAEAQAAGDLQRAKIAGERAFPKQPIALSAPEAGARPPVPQGQVEPFAGKGFVGEAQGVIKEGAEKAIRVGKKRRLDAAAREERAVEASKVGELQRAKIASEKAFPPFKQLALPPAKEGARPPVGRGQVSPFAGDKFVGEAEGFIKEGAEKAIRVGKKRRLDAAAIEGKKKQAVRGSIEAKFAREQGQFQALPAPKVIKVPSQVEKGAVAGEKFVLGGAKGPGAGGKKPSVRENIIEISAGKRAKKDRQVAIEQASKANIIEQAAGKKVIKRTKSVVDVTVKKTKVRKKKGVLGNKGQVRATGEGTAGDKGKAARIVAVESRATAQENAQLAALRETAASLDKSASRSAKAQIKILKRNIEIRVVSKEATGKVGFHRSSNLESIKTGFEQRKLGVSFSNTREGVLTAPTLGEAKGTTGLVEVTVNGKGIDYLKNKRLIDSIIFDAPKGKQKDIHALNVLREQGITHIDNFNGIGAEAGEFLVINSKAIKITSKVKKRFDNRGSAQAFGGGPKKTSDAEKIARVERQQAKLDALKLKKAGKVSPENATIGDVVDGKVEGTIKLKRRNKKGKVISDEELIGKIEVILPETVEVIGKDGRRLTKQVGGTVVGNTKVGEMVKSGEMSERNGKIMIVADKVNPIIGSQFVEINKAERMAAIGNPSIREVLKVVERVDPRELSALHDTPVAQALATAKRAQDSGVPIVQVMDEIAQDLLVARKVANILGVNLQAIRRSAARGELRQILEAQLAAKGTSKFDRIKLREALKDLGSPLARTRFIRTMDMVTKYGINAMLSSPVTFMRNLIGSAIGVGSQIPTKIAQAAISNVASILRIPQTERVYFREVVPELVGIARGFFGRGLRKGARFLKHEEISKVFKEIERKVERVAAVHIPKGQSFSTLKRNKKAALLKQLRRDLTDLLTEEEVTRAAELGFATARESTNLLDKIINIPVRGLVATDKVFQTASATGHIAARRVREAIRTGKPVRDIHLSSEQIEGAKVDAAFQVFRQKLGPTLGGIQNLISETPIMPLMIPFFKSRVNFTKFFLKHSPFGLIDTVIKSVGAGALDTKSAARALSGTAMILGINKFFDDNSDTIQLQPSAGSPGEREFLRESGLGEQVVVFGTNLNDPKKRKVTHTEPYANLAPMSGPLEVIALKQEYYRRLKRGERIDEAFAKTLNKALKGVLNQSAFGSVKDAVRAAENIADSSVALNPDGTPERSTIMSILVGSGGKVVSRKFAGVSIPNIVRDVRKLLDKRIFDAKGFGDELLISLPPIFGKDPAANVPVRQTVFGTDAKQTKKRLPFNPFAEAQKIDRTIEIMIRLEVFPAKAPKKLSVGGLPIVLTEKEQQRFNFLGKILKKTLDDVVALDVFKNAPELAQKKILEELMNNFRKGQIGVAKSRGLIRLLQSREGILQMLRGVTEGFSPF